jgi:hypothetical protein
MRKAIFILSILSFFTANGAAFAFGLTQPTVEYSADQVMETVQGAMTQKVFYAKDKLRQESDMGGFNVVTIIRSDKKLIWQLMPQQNMYMEMGAGMPKQGPSGDLSDYKIEQTVIGDEVVNGYKSTKSKVVMRGRDNMEFGGFMWTTKEGNIMVKMDATATNKGAKHHIRINLKNIRIGKQEPKLFEIPAGYRKMEMPMHR